MNHTLVNTPGGLLEVAEALRGAQRLYLDTEFESGRSGTRLCIVQIATDDGAIHLVDAIALRDLSPLAAPFSAPGVEWVLHAGKQDVALLNEALGIEGPDLIFDTQIAWALLSAETQVGLAYLLNRTLGIRPSKGHQTDDWLRRPLPQQQLDYAASDVEYLAELRQILGGKLKALDREAVVDAASQETIFGGGANPREDPPLTLQSFRNAWQLDGPGLAALNWMVRWYNSLSAHERQGAPKRKALVSIAARLPDTRADLLRIKGVPRGWASRVGNSFTRGLAAAAAGPAPKIDLQPKPYAQFELMWLDAWLAHLRAELCEALQVAPELVMPSWLMKNARAHISQTGDYRGASGVFTGWRAGLIEAGYQRFCDETLPPG